MKLSLKDKHTQSGFSYLELLVVISIFGLLAILLIPNLVQTKNSAQEEKTEQQIINKLQTIKLSLEKFHYNYGYYPVYNFPLPQQSITKLATLKEILNHYSQLSQLLNSKLTEPEKYYYYAPANTDLVANNPFYPSQKLLAKEPFKGANQFLLIYNGVNKYYKLTSYSSSLTIKDKKDTKKALQKQLKSLCEF